MEPNTIDEAVLFILNLSDMEKKNLEKLGSTYFHHTAGRKLRNEWNLWDPDSTLHKNFRIIGIKHPDDMSCIILESAYRILNDLPIDLSGQVKRYKKYWKNLEEKGRIYNDNTG